MINMETEKYYSIEEASKLLKVTYLTVYRWVCANQLMAYETGKQYRVKKDNLERFIKTK